MKLSAWLASKGLFSLLPYKFPHIEPEQSLWRSVIDNALRDMASRDKVAAEEARMWFEEDNEDFITVCEYAGLDPVYVKKIYHEKLKDIATFNLSVSFLKK